MGQMTETCAAGWVKLQNINLRLAAAIYQKSKRGYGKRDSRTNRVPEVIAETCEILGRGDEEEIKNRIHWLRTYYPDSFNEPSTTA